VLGGIEVSGVPGVIHACHRCVTGLQGRVIQLSTAERAER
jgi:hypothetical protein